MIDAGLRLRMIDDSVTVLIYAGLDRLGWFTPSAARKDVHLRPRPYDWDVEIPVNSIIVSNEHSRFGQYALGDEVDGLHQFYVDIYGESTVVSQHIAGDVRDLMLGRVLSGTNSFETPTVVAWDLRLPAPVPFTRLEVDNVVNEPMIDYPRSWQRFWMTVRFDLTDEYGEDIIGMPTSVFSPEFANAWANIKAMV